MNPREISVEGIWTRIPALVQLNSATHGADYQRAGEEKQYDQSRGKAARERHDITARIVLRPAMKYSIPRANTKVATPEPA